MKKAYLILLASLPFGGHAATAFSEEPPVSIQFVKPLGMASAFTAIANDHNIFTFNPAGLAYRQRHEVTISELAVGYSADVENGARFIGTKQGELEDWNNLSPARREELRGTINKDITGLAPHGYAALDLASFVSGPLTRGQDIHVGVGALGGFDARFSMRTTEKDPLISYRAVVDELYPVSFAKRWTSVYYPGYFSAGITAKAIRRYELNRVDVHTSQVKELEDPPFSKGWGAGLDVGFLMQPSKLSAIGLMVQDVGGTTIHYEDLDEHALYSAIPAHRSVIRARTNVGLAHRPQKLLGLRTGNHLTLALDVDDILSPTDHLFFENGLSRPLGSDFDQHLHVGAEYKIAFLSFRAGITGGLPSIGLGIEDQLIKLELAHYSVHIDRPFDRVREENTVVSIGLRFGVGQEKLDKEVAWAYQPREPIRSDYALPPMNLRPTHPVQPVVVPEKKPREEKKTRIYELQEKDTLEDLAKRFYGSAQLWPKIYYANKYLIPDREHLKPGQRIVVPD